MTVNEFIQSTWLDSYGNLFILAIGVVGCSLLLRDIASKLRARKKVYRVVR